MQPDPGVVQENFSKRCSAGQIKKPFKLNNWSVLTWSTWEPHCHQTVAETVSKWTENSIIFSLSITEPSRRIKVEDLHNDISSLLLLFYLLPRRLWFVLKKPKKPHIYQGMYHWRLGLPHIKINVRRKKLEYRFKLSLIHGLRTWRNETHFIFGPNISTRRWIVLLSSICG